MKNIISYHDCSYEIEYKKEYLQILNLFLQYGTLTTTKIHQLLGDKKNNKLTYNRIVYLKRRNYITITKNRTYKLSRYFLANMPKILEQYKD